MVLKMSKKKPFYSKFNLLCFRLFALVAVAILTMSIKNAIRYNDLFSSYSKAFFDITNIISIFLLFFVLIYPQKIEVCSVITFIYSLQIFIFEPNNTMGLFMYILTVAMLYARGFYNIHKKQKNIFTIIIFILLNLSQMRFGSKIFLDSLIQTAGFSFTYLLSIYFIKAAIRNDYNTNSSSNILNLKIYDKLTIRDALWLIQIQNKVKYDAIAINSKVAPRTVKNRLKFIFSVLEVGDKHGFLNEYSTFEICYGEYSSEQISSITFTDDDFIE